LSALLGGLCFGIGCGPGEALLVQRYQRRGWAILAAASGRPTARRTFGALDWARTELTALSMTPLTASAGTTHAAGVTDGEIRHVVEKYLTEHPELLRQAAPAPHGIYVGDSEHQEP